MTIAQTEGQVIRMSEAREGELFPVPETERSTGLLPSQMLRGAIALGHEISATVPIVDEQIQPASLDLRLGEVAYRVRASFLPGTRHTVKDKLDQLSMHRIDLTAGTVLERDCV